MESKPFEFLTSKRFIGAIAYVLSLVIVFYLPEMEGSELELSSGLTIVFGLLIFGYSAEDVVMAIVIGRSLAAKTANKYDDMGWAIVESVAKSAGLDVPAAEVNVNVGDAAHG